MVLVPIVSLSFYNAEQYPNLSSKFGMVWRFAPMADPLVSEWHCRDLDSRISERELAAVKNWQISNKTYHIMRDNRCVSNQTKTILISINDYESLFLTYFHSAFD